MINLKQSHFASAVKLVILSLCVITAVPAICAEAAYARGSLDDAFKLYQQALAVDPKLYYAALFSGDVMMQKEDFKQAEVWYQRAIQIDPNKETAYRYSATPLMKQHKYDEALAR